MQLSSVIFETQVTRIETMAVLRCAGMPISDDHFIFLKFQGLHHILLADVPHLLVSTAMFSIGFDTSSQQDHVDVCGHKSLLSSLDVPDVPNAHGASSPSFAFVRSVHDGRPLK
jgi:hypothetical protein